MSKRLWPLTWPHQGAILENNVPFQICNGPFQIWLVKLRASICIDKYHFLDLYGLCKGFSDVGVSVSVDSLDCSNCISDPVFVFSKFSLSTSFVVFLTKGRVCWPANCSLIFLCLAGFSNFVVCKLYFNYKLTRSKDGKNKVHMF